MGMDRNTVIGFVLIGILLIGMLFINNQSKQEFDTKQAIEKKKADSLAGLNQKVDTSAAKRDAKITDSILNAKKQLPSNFITDTVEQLTTIENDVLKITFTNKGGQPKAIELKKFTTLDKKAVKLMAGDFNKLSYEFKAAGKTSKTSDLFFIKQENKINADSSQSLTYSIKDSTGDVVTHQYILPAPGINGYMLDFNINLKNAASMVDQSIMNFLWQTEMKFFDDNISRMFSKHRYR